VVEQHTDLSHRYFFKDLIIEFIQTGYMSCNLPLDRDT
jgi:hypothetical protein